MTDRLRPEDRVVLQCVDEGFDDTFEITTETGLESHRVRYCLKKLDRLGYVDLRKESGMVERIHDGQKRVFKAPLQASVTADGAELVASLDTGSDVERTEQSLDALVERLEDQEQRIDRLETAVRMLRNSLQNDRFE